MRLWDLSNFGRLQTLWTSTVTYIPSARCAVVRDFLAGFDDEVSGRTVKSDWLLFLDHDMIFSANLAERLYREAHPVERPIVAAFYPTYMPDHGNIRVMPTWMREWEGKPMRHVQEVPEGDELIELHGCGMGATLIHRSVLEAVGEEHFHDEWPWFGHDLVTLDPEIGPVRCGEDVTFCLRARALGFKIWGAPHIRCKHKKSNILDAIDVLPALRIVAA
jgi:hypothetical protein